MPPDFDIAIVGSGYAGSIMAMVARRLGRRVLLLDKSKHPRFAIGESSTPLANLLLEEIAAEFDLPQLLPLTAWGPWQRTHPKIGCGLKRGFSFYHHKAGRPFESRADRSNELLVAASPNDEVADTHWYRPDFDQFLAQEAVKLGVDLIEEVALEKPEFTPTGVNLSGQHQGTRRTWTAGFLIDATGPNGFLHRQLGLEEYPFAHLPQTQALFSHFTGVARWEDLKVGRASSLPLVESTGGFNHTVMGQAGSLPYPPDDAALHHVFDGGWMWVLRFNNGITSAGISVTPTHAAELDLAEGEAAWRRFLGRFPSIGEQFRDAAAARPFVHSPSVGFRCAEVTGERWCLLPSAAGFVDPLLSTGFPLALLGIQRLGRTLRARPSKQSLSGYQTETLADLAIVEELVSALFARMDDFGTFTALTMLYFAAASFSESAKRLGRSELAPGFFLRGHEVFRAGLLDCCHRARNGSPSGALVADIRRMVEPFNVIGLFNPARRNWYPVDFADLYRDAVKLQASREDIDAFLHKAGLR